MPITKSAKKALRGSAKKRVFNNARKKAMKDSVKTIKKSLMVKDVKTAESKIAEAYQAIDKAVKRGVIKKNTASRKKSRLVKSILRTKAAQ
ncbi:MAG TPA: 30S ribosomal protein S20 [Candidatus Paceibacterota bacterium]|jgi:small subunit ribosomal protein S20